MCQMENWSTQRSWDRRQAGVLEEQANLQLQQRKPLVVVVVVVAEAAVAAALVVVRDGATGHLKTFI